MSNLGYLRTYITEQSDAKLEDVLNDEDFLDELKVQDDNFMTL